jgi:hypothetical protein
MQLPTCAAALRTKPGLSMQSRAAAAVVAKHTADTAALRAADTLQAAGKIVQEQRASSQAAAVCSSDSCGPSTLPPKPSLGQRLQLGALLTEACHAP